MEVEIADIGQTIIRVTHRRVAISIVDRVDRFYWFYRVPSNLTRIQSWKVYMKSTNINILHYTLTINTKIHLLYIVNYSIQFLFFSFCSPLIYKLVEIFFYYFSYIICIQTNVYLSIQINSSIKHDKMLVNSFPKVYYQSNLLIWRVLWIKYRKNISIFKQTNI